MSGLTLAAWQSGDAAAAVAVAVCGLLVGTCTMLLYGRLSPQARVAELSGRAAQARAALQRFDGGDVRVVLALSGQAIGLSLRQMGVILPAAVLAAAPVAGAAWALDAALDLSAVRLTSQADPSWMLSGHVAYWLPLTMAAVVVKWTRGIK